MQHEPSSEANVEEPEQVEEPGDESVLVEDAGGSGEETEEELEEELEEPSGPPSLEAQLAEWKDRAMRTAADLENFRKRMAREKAYSLRYANQALLEELLPVLDNFEMGLQAAAGDADSMIFRGMEMVKKQLDDFLGSQGVEEISAEGQTFDPNVHEAVSQEECAEAEEGAVLRVIRRGYRMNDRLLRPANVVVATAPAAAQSEQEGDES